MLEPGMGEPFGVVWDPSLLPEPYSRRGDGMAMGDGALAAVANASLAESYWPYDVVGVEPESEDEVDDVKKGKPLGLAEPDDGRNGARE